MTPPCRETLNPDVEGAGAGGLETTRGDGAADVDGEKVVSVGVGFGDGKVEL